MKKLEYLEKGNRTSLVALGVVAMIAILVLMIAGSRIFTSDDGDIENHENPGVAEDDAPFPADGRQAEMFDFDPNTADSATLVRLGLSSGIVRNICRYRNKGGVFSKPTDFAKIYGLTVGQYRKLEPYIKIGEDFRLASEVYGEDKSYYHAYGKKESSSHSYEKSRSYSRNDGANNDVSGFESRPQKLTPGSTIQLNRADTTQLCRIPGIGPYFARKIARRRELLGGFISKEQLLEIDGFPESALPYMKIDAENIKKIRINHATAEVLRKHPYIDFRQAQSIMEHRRLYGDIKSVAQLKLLHIFTDSMLQKLTSYLDFN